MAKTFDDVKEKIQSQNTKASEKTREHLLEAARDLFALKGYHGVSVKEICDLAKCNISLVSYHFGGKEGLYKKCIEEPAAIERDIAIADLKDVNSCDEFEEQLQVFGDNLLKRASQDFRLFKILSREMETSDLIIADVFERTHYKIFLRMLELFTNAKEKGWFKSEMVPQTSTAIFMGILQHLIRTEGIRQKYFNETIQDEAYRKSIVKQTVDTVLNGIKQ